ncbi:DUF1566 domain-containing protein [Rheinheimera maricola]|uniref:DUF1566 domain-containing protein n=1 Tax=Rheinheimera maricola TaxID=2793282 RepID=A0ABS7XCU4_9GAMM|nr:DUF1566 domain-containing protein [Rheinheimera maricola]MBZ9613376.1 DUF1566 domain-containing protein [Rheinheimera maricola]
MHTLIKKLINTIYLVIGSASLSLQVIADGSCIDGFENAAIPFSTPTSDFTIIGNGTAVHNPTGLMWMQCSMGQFWDSDDNSCLSSNNFYDWDTALQSAQNFSFAGFNDWRLPNKNELASIIEWRCYTPSINLSVFPNTFPTGNYWTSTPASPDSAWYINFSYGIVRPNRKNGEIFRYAFFVRLVRDAR